MYFMSSFLLYELVLEASEAPGYIRMVCRDEGMPGGGALARKTLELN